MVVQAGVLGHSSGPLGLLDRDGWACAIKQTVTHCFHFDIDGMLWSPSVKTANFCCILDVQGQILSVCAHALHGFTFIRPGGGGCVAAVWQ